MPNLKNESHLCVLRNNFSLFNGVRACVRVIVYVCVVYRLWNFQLDLNEQKKKQRVNDISRRRRCFFSVLPRARARSSNTSTFYSSFYIRSKWNGWAQTDAHIRVYLYAHTDELANWKSRSLKCKILKLCPTVRRRTTCGGEQHQMVNAQNTHVLIKTVSSFVCSRKKKCIYKTASGERARNETYAQQQ